MRTMVMFIDDDASLLDAVAPNIRMFLRNRVRCVAEFQSIRDVEEFLADPTDLHPLVAIIDLWMNDIESNTSDQEGGFKIIDRLRRKYSDISLIVYSAHLNQERRTRLRQRYPDIPILSKGDANVDPLLLEIDGALKSKGA